MSLDSVPKTNWESDDGALFSDMDNIGKNLQELEDSKYQETDELTTDTSNFVESNITTANITTLNVDDINPTSLTAASIVIADTASWVPSAGFYIIESIANVIVRINSGGLKDTVAGSFFTDGSLVRVTNNSGLSQTLDYLKL